MIIGIAKSRIQDIPTDVFNDLDLWISSMAGNGCFFIRENTLVDCQRSALNISIFILIAILIAYLMSILNYIVHFSSQ